MNISQLINREVPDYMHSIQMNISQLINREVPDSFIPRDEHFAVKNECR